MLRLRFSILDFNARSLDFATLLLHAGLGRRILINDHGLKINVCCMKFNLSLLRRGATSNQLAVHDGKLIHTTSD